MKTFILLMLSPLLLFGQTQIGEDIDGLNAGDNAGYSVSISNNGNIVAVGSPGYDINTTGHVRIYENNEGNWIQIGETIYGEYEGDHFGTSVSLSADGSIIAIGGPDNEETTEIAGHVQVYENIGGDWSQIGEDIDGEAEGLDGKGFLIDVRFGKNVSLSSEGNILAITKPRGGTFEPGYGRDGHIQIFENIEGDWTQMGDYINTEISYLNDISISAVGNFVAVSGRGDFDPFWFYARGFVKVYMNNSGIWSQVGNTFIGEWDELGFISGVSLSQNGSKISIGGGEYNTRVFEYINGEWIQEGGNIESEINIWNSTNTSLSDNGNILAIGGTITRLYENNFGNWTQLGVGINGETSDDDYGSSLELSNDGSTLIVGAPLNDGTGEDAGHARVYDLNDLLSVNTTNKMNAIFYPNPTKDILHIESQQQLETVKIYSLQGQLIKEDSSSRVDVSQLASGLYFVQVTIGGQSVTKKFIKE